MLVAGGVYLKQEDVTWVQLALFGETIQGFAKKQWTDACTVTDRRQTRCRLLFERKFPGGRGALRLKNAVGYRIAVC